MAAPSNVTLKVEGMMCGHCVGNVKEALEAVEGVTSAEVDLASETAVVAGTAPAAALIAATDSVGKPSKVIATVTLKVEGMMCGHCVGNVKEALEAVQGVTAAEVDLAKESATVVGTAPVDALIAATDSVGKPSKLVEPIKLKVEGMMCGHCVGNVKEALEAVAGVMSAEVDLASETATVIGTAPAAALTAATDSVGKPSKVVGAETTVTLKVEGMTCKSCVGKVQKALYAVEGVSLAEVALEAGTAVVTGSAALQTLLDATAAVGKKSVLMGDNSSPEPPSPAKRDGSAPIMRRGAPAGSIREQSAAAFNEKNGSGAHGTPLGMRNSTPPASRANGSPLKSVFGSKPPVVEEVGCSSLSLFVLSTH